MFSTRLFFSSVFIVCAGLLGFGLYLEHVVGLEPCPLCVFQRVTYIVIALFALIGAIHNPQKLFERIYTGLILIASLCGAGIAGRQIWLQHLPADKVPECGPGLEYMLDVFPFTDALRMVLSGSGECAEIQWTFLSFSIAEWSIVCFTGLTIVCLASLIYRK
ncbi:MAG: disulfide bond formation protein B [Gammaproteobacteria bacterium]|nr:MAG: disulfide bond formation protein B [Gammaproteobacteria bacterium]RKZ65718.1 MAG: disulfide bond formation protein B [Gammaproteobacteria bacterium]